MLAQTARDVIRCESGCVQSRCVERWIDPCHNHAMAARAHAILPDVLAPGLRVVFCGTAPGTRSARDGAYYAHPGNHFWRTLFEVGLTPRLLAPHEFGSVAEYGIGLTDVAKHHFGADAELPRGAFDATSLRRKLVRYHPRIIAFTSKNAARAGLAMGMCDLAYGEQDAPIARSRVFVLPSPSGQARRFWDTAPWHAMAAAAGTYGATTPDLRTISIASSSDCS